MKIGDHYSSCSGRVLLLSAGDTILVGPGRYGNLNRDGVLSLQASGDGEEDPNTVVPNTTCVCIILVNKSVTILSRDGAGGTMIDGGGIGLDVVSIAADSVIFGKPGKGFTVANAGIGHIGLVINQGTNGVRVSGNIAVGNKNTGFDTAGINAKVSNNLAMGSLFGFFTSGSGANVTANRASNNDRGFQINPSAPQAVPIVLSANEAVGNLIGFRIFGTVAGEEIQILGNGILANVFEGIVIIQIIASSDVTISHNNIFGNNVAADDNGLTNCGLLQQTGTLVVATNNFWGAPGGPGANPADDVCNITSGSTTAVAPVATTEFKVEASVF